MGRKVVGNSGQRPFAPAALPLTKGLHDSSATQSGAPRRATLLLTTGATTDPGRQIQFGLKFLF
jgi:hypothetical protein